MFQVLNALLILHPPLVGLAGNKTSGDSNGSGGGKSMMTIAFQFAYEIHLQGSVTSMARQYVRSIISSVQRVASALSPSRFGSRFARAEAIFADLGHFSQLSLRIAFTGFVYPCLVFAYMGEAAYLSEHRNDLQSSFYKAIPEPIFWPVFVIATLATVAASQAIISATFSIISQCRALKCFPRVKIVHTSDDIYGRVYIPEANWVLMVLCLAVVLDFRDTDKIGNAYGFQVCHSLGGGTWVWYGYPTHIEDPRGVPEPNDDLLGLPISQSV